MSFTLFVLSLLFVTYFQGVHVNLTATPFVVVNTRTTKYTSIISKDLQRCAFIKWLVSFSITDEDAMRHLRSALGVESLRMHIITSFTEAKMPDLAPPSKGDPILHPADIFSFLKEHRAKSKTLCQGSATLLGAALMKEDSWKWVDRRQLGRETLDYGTSLGVNYGSTQS